MKYILLPAILFTVLSCSKHYKIVEQNENSVLIELPARTSPENMIDYADEATKDLKSDDSFVSFIVPSAYPNNPGGSTWAKMHYYKHELDGFEIHGTRTNLHKKNLLALKPKSNKVIGKWYFPLPIMERIIFIEEINGKIVLRQTGVKVYCHHPNAGISKYDNMLSSQWSETEFAEWDEIELVRNPDNPNEFKEKQWEKGTWRYRIDQGKLYFPDENGKISKYNLPAIAVP